MRQANDSLSERLRRLESENKTLGARVVELQREVSRLEKNAQPLTLRLARSAV